MASIDYDSLLAEIKRDKAEMNAVFDTAIAGVEALMALQARQHPATQDASRQVRQVQPRRDEVRKALFGRDPLRPTVADLAVTVMSENDQPIHISELRQKIKEKGREVTEQVLRDSLTRRDKVGRFKKHGGAMFSLCPAFESGNGHYEQN
jgi:hypothetical protein